MTAIQKKILIAGIKIKLNRVAEESRATELEVILATYVNLTEAEKQEIRDYFNGGIQ